MKRQQVEHLVHKKSAVLGKKPTPSAIELGEIAVNYNASNPFLSIKDSNNEIIKIQDSSYVLCEGSLPSSGRDKIYYVLKTTNPVLGTTTYELYIYNDNTWEKLSNLASDYSAGDNITIDNKEISSNQVENVTTAAYNRMVQEGSINPAKLYNLTDQTVINPEEYQKKLIIGDNLRLSPENVLDCTFDAQPFVIVSEGHKPAVGEEGKIYFEQITNPDDNTTVFRICVYEGGQWFDYGYTNRVTPYMEGNGIAIDSTDNTIQVHSSSGLTFSNDGSLITNLGAGLTFDSSKKITPNITAPIILDNSNRLTVSSSSTYTSTGNELFTRAGAYNLYSQYLVPQEITLTPNTAVVDTSNRWWSKAFRVGKFVSVSVSLGLITGVGADETTVLFSGLPQPLAGYTEVSFNVGDTFNKNYAAMLQLYNDGTIKPRVGYAFGQGVYLSGMFSYIAA